MPRSLATQPHPLPDRSLCVPHRDDVVERLQLLVPQEAARAPHDLLAYALAYAEHYCGDILALDHERDVLTHALSIAWQRAEHPSVIILVTALAHLCGRMGDTTEAVRVLHLGIRASQQVGDRVHVARFVNRLGGVLFAHGNYTRGRRLWFRGLRFAGSTGSPHGLWEPLSSVAYIADILGNYDAARQFADTLLHARTEDDEDAVAVAVLVRGLYARAAGELSHACHDYRSAIRILASCPAEAPQAFARQMVLLIAEAELARAQGSYVRAHTYAETALSLAQLFSDRYTTAALLIDQAQYAYSTGHLADISATYVRLRAIALQMQTAHIHRFSHLLEHWLAAPCSGNTLAASVHEHSALPAPADLYERLSERETEVLRLVANGLSSREIAEQLIITSATVKKHLEHTYSKLGVHSRMAAVARARLLAVLP